MANDQQLSLSDSNLSDAATLTDKDREVLRRSMGMTEQKPDKPKKSM